MKGCYYFLGLALDQDILKGDFYPSFVLCHALTTSSKRTGLRVIKNLDGKPSKNLPKVLVTEPNGHDDLLDFLSVYQTQDGLRGKHYHPEGALCWYACNQYGDPTGEVIYARKVPIKNLMWSFAQKREFRMKGFYKVEEFKNLFKSERGYEDYKTTKPVLWQRETKKKGKKLNGNGKNR